MSEETPAPAPRPERKAASRRADTKREAATAAKAAGAEPAIAAEPIATEEPKPLEVPLEDQISALPPLEYPGGPNEEFAKWAAERRHGRLRIEIIGGALLVLAGVTATIVSGRVAFVVIAVFLVGCLAVYEFLVSSFE